MADSAAKWLQNQYNNMKLNLKVKVGEIQFGNGMRILISIHDELTKKNYPFCFAEIEMQAEAVGDIEVAVYKSPVYTIHKHDKIVARYNNIIDVVGNSDVDALGRKIMREHLNAKFGKIGVSVLH